MERTNQQVLERIRAEYLEMPGMRLRVAQVQRLCGVDAAVCAAVMDALVAMNFLRLNPDGTYVRVGQDSTRLRPIKAELPVPAVAARRAG
jgi:hypothetical protein